MKAIRRILAALLLVTLGVSLGWGFTFILNVNTPPQPTDTGLPIKWPAGPTSVPVSIPILILADNTVTLSDGTTRATAIQTAMTDTLRGWNRYLGNVQFAPQIKAVANGADGNSINEIFFASTPYDMTWDTNTLAVTTDWAIGNQRVESDIIFNTAYTWDSYRGAVHTQKGSSVDIQRVALHELGHVLGLDHPDQAVPPQHVAAVMNSIISDTDSLTSDDIAGGQSLYGPPGAPANDNFANAIEITLTSNGTATVTGYDTNATKEPGEPKNPVNVGGRSVWWKWTAPATGAFVLDTKGSYSDTILAVYTGSTLATLTPVASNDDIKPGIIQASLLTLNTTAGTTYYIQVDGYNSTPIDNYGADSSAITLNLTLTTSAPFITTQPSSQTVTAGSNVTFSVAASGSGTLTYQWNFGGTAIAGATSSSVTLSNVSASNAGSYTVTVTNSLGSVTSNAATLTVNPVPVPTPTPTPSGGGGGGAPSLWFLGSLSVLALARRLRPRH